MLRIRFFDEEHHGETYPIDPEVGATFGRGADNTVRVRDKNTSRTHCQITITEEGCLVADMESTNGTFVNGERITEQIITPGDKVRIGITVFGVEEAPDGREGSTAVQSPD